MCGLAGELRFGANKSGANWSLISELMRRRGPDDQGEWSDIHAHMVFRRLSILDLSPAGHQPMQSADLRYTLTFNGELYNFRELREILIGKGVRFRSSGDTEVVLNALIHWGTDALAKFNGMFAIAFYDSAEKRITLARDHAGIKPLYYLHDRAGVMYASQYDQIMAHPWSRSCAVSKEALSLYLRFAATPAPYGLLERTYMLEPGAWIQFGQDGTQRGGVFFEMPKYQMPELRGDEAVDELSESLDKAIKRQLVSDVPVASFLSGGIDSPLVLSRMSAIQPDQITAFSIGTDSPESDESHDAELYARELGVRHVLHRMSENEAMGLLSDVVTAASEPFGDYSIFPTMLVSRLAAQNFKVILSGDGGDELFWGYVRRMTGALALAPRFKKNYGLRRAEWQARKLLRLGAGREYLNFRDLGHWQAFVHTHMRGPAKLARVFPGIQPIPAGFADFSYNDQGDDKTAQWLRWNEYRTHLSRVLLKVDRASMHESLEVRVPLLDREFIETATKVDWSSCLDLKTRTGKLPLRALLRKNLSHQTTGKRGFEIPMGDWLRSSLKEPFQELVLGRSDLLGMEMDTQYLRRIFALHESGKHDLGRALWPILSLAMWAQRHYENRAF